MAGQGQPTITYFNLLASANNVDITKATIQLYLQITFGPGFYTVGGVAAGLKAYASSLGISANAQFLFQDIESEAQTIDTGNVSLPTTGGYAYKYIPSLDVIQIFTTQGSNAGLELGASQAIPPGVLNDIIIGNFVWNRL